MFMRTKFFVAAAALCLTAFTACSDNEVLKPEVGGDNTYLFNEEGKGYIRLSLDVPVETRAISTNDDGDLNEYKVNNIYLLIFSGANEADAKFTSAYDLTSNFTKNGQAEITSTAEIIKEINKEGVGSADNLYAYVMLNKPASLTFSGNSITLGAVTSYSNGSFKAPTSTEGMTFSAFKTLVINNQADETYFRSNGFFMGNSPLSDKNDADASTVQVTTLRKIEANSIYPSQAAAEQGNASTKIYVERAVAKVTVNEGATFDDGTYNAELQGWILDITNKKSFPVRNMGTASAWWGYNVSSDYRFVGSSPVNASAAAKYYRTYFGIDPNYNGTDGTSYLDAQNNVLSTYEGFNINYGNTPLVTQLNTIGSNAYCLENTFNVNNMRKDQTTRVIVAAKLTIPGAEADGSFFVLNNDKTTFYAKADVVNLIKNAYIKSSFVQNIINDPTTGLDVGSTFDENDIVVKFKKGNSEPKENIGDLDGGTILVAEVYTAATASEDFKGDVLPEGLRTNNTSVTEYINDMYVISFYKSGIAYYPVMIKHFGDDQTPWSGMSLNYTESYPNNDGKRDNNWLGRYGVLRNNWYEIEVTAVKNIGSAEVEPETGYDDPVESWISVEINALSWAKRKQNVEL